MEGSEIQTASGSAWDGRQALVEVVLGDSAPEAVEAILEALSAGATGVQLASAVSYAAALRIGRFHVSNEFGDWDTALHTFTFANAVEQGMRRAPSMELLRGVFDAAMSVYLDRFLNIPSSPFPQQIGCDEDVEQILGKLPDLLDRQQQVNEAATAVAAYLCAGGALDPVMAMLGHLLLREDRDFHTIQAIEAAFRQVRLLTDPHEIAEVMVAATRYLAAHTPSVRAQGQTFQIARRLHRGEALYT
jgi:hypothetical protein